MSGQAVSGQSPAPLGAGDDAQAAFAPADASRRLADQLNTLSEVVETITYRLLELEERLAAQELRLQALCEESATDCTGPAAVEFRLDDTEERLLRIEAMLTGIDQPGSAAEDASGLGVGSVPTWHQAGSGGAAVAGENDLDGPFPEEPEQPFLDELEGDSV